MTKQKRGVYNTKTAIFISELPETYSSLMNSEPIPYLLVWPKFSKRRIHIKLCYELHDDSAIGLCYSLF